MRKYAGAVAIIGLALATPAAASQINVTVTGTLTAQKNEVSPGNTGIDENLAVGDIVTLTASFDASLLIPVGDFGYSIAGLHGLPTSGNSFFRIDAPGMTWQSSDDLYDGFLFSVGGGVRASNPAIVIQGDKVIGLIGELSPAGSSARPEIGLGAGIGNPAFSIDAVHGLYANFYNTPGFTGLWDFANSSVTDPPDLVVTADAISAAPEPATWAMFLIGFGAVGFAMRRRDRALAI